MNKLQIFEVLNLIDVSKINHRLSQILVVEVHFRQESRVVGIRKWPKLGVVTLMPIISIRLDMAS